MGSPNEAATPMQQVPQQQQQQSLPSYHPSGHHLTPSLNKKRLAIAAAALVLAAVVAVAVAIPVSVARSRTTALSNNPGSGSSSSPTGGSMLESGRASTSSSSSNKAIESVPADTPACNGVPGLCSVPVRYVTFAGTHNSNAIKNPQGAIAETQKLGFKEQLEAGVRLFDLDYAGSQNGARFGHCLGCFCSYAADPAEADPAQVFAVMADFLMAHPHDLIVLGMSNINCGDKAAARQQLLSMLAGSALNKLMATQVIQPSTTLSELVDSNQRVVLLFYDQWTTAVGYQVGNKMAPDQPLFRLYGENTSVDARGAAAVSSQVAQRLFNDISSQFSASPPSSDTPWRVLGLFASMCFACRDTGQQCGPISCATKVNSQSYVDYLNGKITAQWLKGLGSKQTPFVPAFNGYQVDYIEVPNDQPSLISSAQSINEGFAWAFTQRSQDAAKLGLGNCAWVLDDAQYAGRLVCVHDGLVGLNSLPRQGSSSSDSGSPAVAATGGDNARRLAVANSAAGVDSSSSASDSSASSAASNGIRQLIVPANSKLQVQLLGSEGQLIQQVVGSSNGIQTVDLPSTVDALQLSWPRL